MELRSVGCTGGEAETLVYLLTDEGECASLLNKLKESGECPEGVCLISVPIAEWNRDMTPWPAPKVFGKGEDFTGGADRFLAELGESIERFEEESGMKPAGRVLGGYSLGGLFSVYGSVNAAGLFTAFLSVSGSMWYDGFGDWLEKKELPAGLKRAYFSVGDREKNSKNERMKRVETETKRIAALFRARGVDSVFELNPGTHFTDPEGRILKGILSLFQ